jgi:hypothetical protein
MGNIFPETGDIYFEGASDLQALATLGQGPGSLFQGYKNGTTAFVGENAAQYILQDSTATPDGVNIIATQDDPNRRWVKNGGGGGDVSLTDTEIAFGSPTNTVTSSADWKYLATQGPTSAAVGTFAADDSVFTAVIKTLTGTVQAFFRFLRGVSEIARYTIRQSTTVTAHRLSVTGDDGRRGLFETVDDNTGLIPLLADLTDGDVYNGSPTEIAADGTTGFAWSPTIAGDPTGVPAKAAGTPREQVPTVFNPHNGKTWTYNPVTPGWSQIGLTPSELGGLDYLIGRWEQVQERTLLSLVPQLTAFEPITIPSGSALPANAVDADIEGGAITTASTVTLQPTIIQAPKTGKVALACWAKFDPTAGHVGVIGVSDGTHSITFGNISGSTYELRIIDGASTSSDTGVTMDAGWHWFQLFTDGLHWQLAIDGTLTAASLATSLLTADTSMNFVVATAASGYAIMARTMNLLGFVLPT